MRCFRDFLCFRSSQRKGGSGRRKGEGHKANDCSKTILDPQLGCKRPPDGTWHSPMLGRRFPFPWRCTEGHILQPYAFVSFIAGCFSLLQCQWQPLELTLLVLVQVSVQREGWCPPSAAVIGKNYQKVNASYTAKLEKFMVLLWSFHYSTESSPDYSTPAWQLASLERGTLMHLMYIHDQNADCWQSQRKNNEMP